MIQTEYVQQMVSAGFINSEDLDDDYQEYLKKSRHHEEQMSYADYQWTIKRLEELNVFYKAKLEPLYAPDAPPMSWTEKQIEENYLAEVSCLESALCY